MAPGPLGAQEDLQEKVQAQLRSLQDDILGKPVGYVYVDDSGHQVQVDSLEKVPKRYRASAQAVKPTPAAKSATPDAGTAGPEIFDGDVAELGVRGNDSPQVVYRYKNRQGREVYTNIVEKVPPDQLDGAAMDLSHITLNSEVGREISHKLDTEHDELAATPYCEAARGDAKQSFLETAWDTYAPLIVMGLLLLLFVLFTPVALKRVPAPVWSRTLTMAIPSLALAGVIMFAMMKTNETISQMKQKAADCDKDNFTALSEAPNPIGRQADLVKRLQDQINTIDSMADEYRIYER